MALYHNLLPSIAAFKLKFIFAANSTIKTEILMQIKTLIFMFKSLINIIVKTIINNHKIAVYIKSPQN
ncbi:hypothetical protein CNEO4_1050062 [Clostridium neonatale]|nr:hypothetical protein CNEO4_1050062 [Clostridium neonatale]